MQFNYAPPKSKTQINTQITDLINEMIAARLSAVEAKLLKSAAVLDGVSLEELVNFSIPLTAQQTPDQIHDGVLLAYKDGKLVEETDLNGGSF